MKCKILTLSATATLAAVFALAAGVELNGYHILDHKNGDNPLCSLDPSCRKLTSGEVQMLTGIFGRKLDTTKVKVFNRSFMGVIGTRACSLSPNGNIYIPGYPAEVRKDFSQAKNLATRKHFAHESTHVWQYQSGRDVLSEALHEFRAHDYDYAAAYSYDINTETDFMTLNLEQQAELVSHDYAARENLHMLLAKKANTASIAEACKTVKPLETLLGNVFPAEKERACMTTKMLKKHKRAPKPPSPSQPAPIKLDFSGCFDVQTGP